MSDPAAPRRLGARRWVADTLFWRLFASMWLALVLSHVAAFLAVTGVPWASHGDRARPRGLPTFPSLPPTPGVPDTPRAGDRSPGPAGAARPFDSPGHPPAPPFDRPDGPAPPLDRPPGSPTDGPFRPPGADPGGPGPGGGLGRGGGPGPGDGHGRDAGRGPVGGLGRDGGRGPGGEFGRDGGPGPGDRGDPAAAEPGARAGLPTSLLVLDYAVRLLVIAAAAALAARWLAAPMRRLVDASSALATSLGHGGGGSLAGDPARAAGTALPQLDEHRGTVEVREAARVFNRMARELERQFRARGLFVAALSHDLKTPLTRLRLRLEGDERSAADIREMAALVDSALEVFRPSAEEERAVAVDVAALVQSLVDDAVERGESVTSTTAGTGATAAIGSTVIDSAAPAASAAIARVAPLSLKRVLDNVLGNALRYAGAAEIAVQTGADRIEIVVADRGPGIPPPLLEAVFEPFVRVDSSRHRASGGTGLGLYIARDLLSRHGGSIALAPREGGGLVATIRLPRA